MSFFRFVVYPTIIGFSTFTGGAVYMYIDAKSSPTHRNVGDLFETGMFGASVGFFCGLLFPITIPVVVGAYLLSEKKKQHE